MANWDRTGAPVAVVKLLQLLAGNPYLQQALEHCRERQRRTWPSLLRRVAAVFAG